ncbi:hypothetical protein G9A89_002296 [Geosiphon pyriformis]|nr:hypothetical protein G9A89_002296 [Geosiphon pyriformis]
MLISMNSTLDFSEINLDNVKNDYGDDDDELFKSSSELQLSSLNVPNPNEYFDFDGESTYQNNISQFSDKPEIELALTTNNPINKDFAVNSVSPSNEEKREFYVPQLLSYSKEAYCEGNKNQNQIDELWVKTIEKNSQYTLAFGANEKNLEKSLQGSGAEMIDFEAIPDAKINGNFFVSYTKWAKDHIFPIIKSIAEKNIQQVVLTGYGLAGVYAHLTGFFLNLKLNSESITVITFGQPRFGNKALADAFNTFLVARFTFRHDPVPRQPVKSGDQQYIHSGVEFWSSAPGVDFIGCEINKGEYESKLCVNKDPILKPEDHFGPYLTISMATCK